MHFAQLINRVLARFGLALVRKATLARLEAAQQLTSSPKAEVEEQQIAIELTIVRQQLDTLAAQHAATMQGQISNASRVIDAIDSLLPESDTIVCSLCNATSPRTEYLVKESQCVFGGGRLRRYQCPNCDVIFGPDKTARLSALQLTEEYAVHFRAFTEAYEPPAEIRAFHLLEPKMGGRYLNYGCGANTAGMRELRAAGWDVWGYEPNERAIDTENYVVRSSERLHTMSFDGVYSSNVLEHFQDPVTELRTMNGLLKVGGRMAHATPCFEYLYEYTRFHLFFFTGRSRNLLAQKAQMDVVSFTADKEFMCLVMQSHR